jgi:hypothetical protein
MSVCLSLRLSVSLSICLCFSGCLFGCLPVWLCASVWAGLCCVLCLSVSCLFPFVYTRLQGTRAISTLTHSLRCTVRARFPAVEVVCWAFACPPCVSLDLAHATRSYIYGGLPPTSFACTFFAFSAFVSTFSALSSFCGHVFCLFLFCGPRVNQFFHSVIDSPRALALALPLLNHQRASFFYTL